MSARAPARARPLDGRGRRAARRPRGTAQAAVLRRAARDRARGARPASAIASELRAEAAENRLVERGTAVRHGLLGLYSRRVQRGEGNPLPSFRKGVFASTELAAIWQLPSIDYLTVPFARSGLPLAPAPPGDPASAVRPRHRCATRSGPVSIHEQLRRQNTAVPGTVEQGKSSYLVATVAEDLRRERCAVIVLDPKGDAAEAAVSVVPAERTCTLLDFSHPTCGFNPLAVDAPRRRDRRLRRGGAEEPLHRCGHPRILRPLSAQRDHRRAGLRPRLDAVGRGAAAVGGGGGLRVSQQRRRPRAGAARVQGDLRVLHGGAERAAGGRSQHDHGEARRAGEQARAAAQLAVDQARAAQRLAASRLRPRDRRRGGARRQGRARRDGRGEHLRADAAARRHARRRARASAGSRARRAQGGGRAEGRRGAARDQPRLRRDDGAEALGRARDGRLLADRRAVDRARGARPAGRAVRASRVLRDRLGARRARTRSR